MTLRIASVPHTGTMFTQALLGLDSHTHLSDLRVDKWLEDGDKIVMPMRDPALAFITTLNRHSEGMNIRNDLEKAAWMAQRPNVHVFRVDCPIYQRGKQIGDLSRFTGLGWDHFGVGTDWTPINTTEDATGWRRAYERGEYEPRLRTFLDSLSQHVHRMLWDLGYALPWMKAEIANEAAVGENANCPPYGATVS